MKIIKYLVYILIIAWLVYKYGLPYLSSYNATEEVTVLYQNMSSDSIPWETIGHSTNGNNIYALVVGDSTRTTLIFGGFHGSEPGGFDLALRLSGYIYQNPQSVSGRLVIIPVLNPDGLLKGKRQNANNVDLNRNFPTRNWSPTYSDDRYYPGSEPASEVETRLVMNIMDQYKPDKIISIHAPLHVINYDGPALSLAKKMALYNSYEVSGDIGYATPGSFGTYAGKELNIPTITLELPHYNPEKAWEENRQALIEAINF